MSGQRIFRDDFVAPPSSNGAGKLCLRVVPQRLARVPLRAKRAYTKGVLKNVGLGRRGVGMRQMYRNFFTSRRAAIVSGLAVAGLLSAPAARGFAQAAAGATTPAAQTGTPTTSEPAPATSTAAQVGAQTSSETTAPAAPATAEVTLSNTSVPKRRRQAKVKTAKAAKGDRVQQTKDTKVELRKQNKYNPLVGKDAQLPDKQLYDKAMAQAKSGHFDVARLDLQTLLNTYPDSQYQMRAKLAVADTWYREGGSAALAQAEQEYKDFITFFPNVPEAAEAQMRVGDIYFKQMDVPDRDYAKATHAEEEYRNMLKQYPDAPKEVLAQARQKLREVQEVMATREFELGQFYSTHENWPATIARYQTVIDTYPQYSHMDDTLIGLGDAYATEGRLVRTQATCGPGVVVACLPEGAKAKLEQEYDGKAASAYRKVVLEHAAAPHVEDAKERLAGMNLPIPTPTAEEVASSEALEGSRAQYNLRKRLELLFLRKPDTVTAASAGDPPLEDPPITTAPSVVAALTKSFSSAVNPNAAAEPAPSSPGAPAPAAPAPAADNSAPAAPAAAPTLSDVPAAGTSTGDAATSNMTTVSPSSGGTSVGNSGASLGVEVLTPGVSTGRDPSAPGPVSAPSTPPLSTPAAAGKQDPNYGITAAAPKNTSALPPVEQPAAADDQVNDVAGKEQPAAEVKDPKKKKNPKPAFDKNDESSSKHKKKSKLNPF